MSEQTAPTEGTEEANEQAAGVKEFQAITSQEDFDKAIQARLARERAKFANYDEGQAALARLAEIEEANKSESEKVAERLAAAEKRAQELELAANRATVAAAKGVPVELLTGDSVEALEAQADALNKFKDDSARSGHVAPFEGRGESVSGTTADAFARFVEGQLSN